MNGRHARLIALGTGLAGILLLAGRPLAADESSPAGTADTATSTATTTDTASAGGYVGSEACIKCHEHEERAQDLLLTLHGKSPLKDWDGAVGCETCHGPGEAHVKGKGKTVGMLDPKEMKSREITDLCTKCHDGNGHEFWQGGAHEGRGLSCLTCHQIHQLKSDVHENLLLKPTIAETCTTCHMQKKAAIMRSSHMPLREGSMTCTSCHNPHGSIGPSQINALSVNDLCYTCHAEKRSPNLWEHPPVKENCLNCHDPHGSLHPSMLKQRTPRLCQGCHDESRHPSQPFGSAQPPDEPFFPSQRFINHGCVNCHVAIHGSNHPSGARFTR